MKYKQAQNTAHQMGLPYHTIGEIPEERLYSWLEEHGYSWDGSDWRAK